MTEYFEVLFIDASTDDMAGDVPEAVGQVRDRCWQTSAHVRWRYAPPMAYSDAIQQANMVVLALKGDLDTMRRGDAILRAIQGTRLQPPTMVVGLGDRPSRPRAQESGVLWIPGVDLCENECIDSALKSLRVELPKPPLKLKYEAADLEIGSLIEWIGEGRFKLEIQKYFPNAVAATVWPVAGGWSGTRLCQIFLEGDDPSFDQVFYLKFFTEQAAFITELKKHRQAHDWLGDALVCQRLVPDVSPRPDWIAEQVRAFPRIRPAAFPACYESASSADCRRQTLKGVYEARGSSHADGEFVAAAFDKVLAILATGKNDACPRKSPWDDSPEGFPFSPLLKRKIIATINDLRSYGPGVLRNWTNCYREIKALVYQPRPRWLTQEPCRVHVGRIHGDPNVRNCLVNPGLADDIRLIDCGGYTDKGRLVSDLAVIERDVKLLLMATEREAGPYFDLDVHQAARWCEVEKHCIEKGLEYAPQDAAAGPPDRSTLAGRCCDAILRRIAHARGGVYLRGFAGTAEPAESGYRPEVRAYRLIGTIRLRARELSLPHDPEGRHYCHHDGSKTLSFRRIL